MSNRLTIALAVALAGVALATPGPASAQKARAASAAKALGSRAAEAPPRFADAASTWADIQVQTKDLAEMIRQKRLDEIHPVAFEIRDLVRTLPDKSAALPAASRSKLAAQVRVVDRLAEQLDRYGDAGKQAETARQAEALNQVLATINSLYPAGSLTPPAGPSTARGAERELYLTPGGVYTRADIQANGNQLPAQRFRGVKLNHDLKPKLGDRICPITLTKANPGYSWVVGGKEYLFCCPPCVQEFVTKAKKSTDPLPPPASFVKKAE